MLFLNISSASTFILKIYWLFEFSTWLNFYIILLLLFCTVKILLLCTTSKCKKYWIQILYLVCLLLIVVILHLSFKIEKSVFSFSICEYIKLYKVKDHIFNLEFSLQKFWCSFHKSIESILYKISTIWIFFFLQASFSLFPQKLLLY